MLVDDAWATIGSCNLHSSSLFGKIEMNASLDPEVVRYVASCSPSIWGRTPCTWTIGRR